MGGTVLNTTVNEKDLGLTNSADMKVSALELILYVAILLNLVKSMGNVIIFKSLGLSLACLNLY